MSYPLASNWSSNPSKPMLVSPEKSAWARKATFSSEFEKSCGLPATVPNQDTGSMSNTSSTISKVFRIEANEVNRRNTVNNLLLDCFFRSRPTKKNRTIEKPIPRWMSVNVVDLTVLGEGPGNVSFRFSSYSWTSCWESSLIEVDQRIRCSHHPDHFAYRW